MGLRQQLFRGQEYDTRSQYIRIYVGDQFKDCIRSHERGYIFLSVHEFIDVITFNKNGEKMKTNLISF